MHPTFDQAKKNKVKKNCKKRISWITKYFGGSDPVNELYVFSFRFPHFKKL